MTRFQALFVVATGLLVGTQPLFAQEVGDRVRVTTDAGSRVIGRILAARSDGFDLGMAGGRAGSFSRADILRIERSLGTRTRWRQGLLYGAVSGVALAAILAANFEESGGCTILCFTKEEVFVAGSIVLGLGGGVVGAVVGLLTRGPERWEEVTFGGVDASFDPIVDLRLYRGHPAAVLGARLRL